MFTGIIKALGSIKGFDQDSRVLTIRSPLFSSRTFLVGQSIAVDGVCLTVSHFTDSHPDEIGFDIGLETKNVSLLTKKSPGDMVNIEPALVLGDALDGHMVQGHVDGIAQLSEVHQDLEWSVFTFSYPQTLAPYIVKKGSITVDGISLTVNQLDETVFSVCLVPHTLANTTLGTKLPGAFVHIETDIIGRYVERISSQKMILLSPTFEDART